MIPLGVTAATCRSALRGPFRKGRAVAPSPASRRLWLEIRVCFCMASDGAWMTCWSWSLLSPRALERQWTESCVLLFEYILFCWFTPVCGATEGEIPALPLPKIYPDGFIAFPVSVMQNGCTRFRHTEYVTYGNMTAEHGFKGNPIHFLMFSSETYTVFAMPAQDTTHTKHYSRP